MQIGSPTMSPKRILIEIVGALPHGRPRMIASVDDCTRALLEDIPFMATDTLLHLLRGSSRVVVRAVRIELAARDPVTAWRHGPIVTGPLPAHDDIPEPPEDAVAVAEDFLPYGEDTRIPKHIWTRA